MSSRRPNLQNQPALEKDVYKIRKCVVLMMMVVIMLVVVMMMMVVLMAAAVVVTVVVCRAFRASEGNTLIVADYGQLELRVLAHVSNCRSMIQAFIDGGDFHSRTAINM